MCVCKYNERKMAVTREWGTLEEFEGERLTETGRIGSDAILF